MIELFLFVWCCIVVDWGTSHVDLVVRGACDALHIVGVSIVAVVGAVLEFVALEARLLPAAHEEGAAAAVAGAAALVGPCSWDCCARCSFGFVAWCRSMCSFPTFEQPYFHPRTAQPAQGLSTLSFVHPFLSSFLQESMKKVLDSFWVGSQLKVYQSYWVLIIQI